MNQIQVPISEIKHIIDCSITQLRPQQNWMVIPPDQQIPTRFNGRLTWNKETQKEALYLSDKQANMCIEGNNLREELSDKLIVVLPANVLDYLLANPYLIPEDWKNMEVFFWGTIYHHSNNGPFVRSLSCSTGGVWNAGRRPLDSNFGMYNPTALPTNMS